MLAAQPAQFRESGTFTEDAVLLSALKKRQLAMEEEMHHGKREFASLRRELSRVHESFEQRIPTEAESASGRANEAEQPVREVRSTVENVREALSEVRELAERAQMKAESTEARLWRVARIEAAVSALRTAPVVPALAPLTQCPAVLPIASAPAATCSACGVPPATAATRIRRLRLNSPLTALFEADIKSRGRIAATEGVFASVARQLIIATQAHY
jgi:hypothetical protein